MSEIDLQELIQFDRAVPRYTSYPTAPQFISMDEKIYREKLEQSAKQKRSHSLYIHIPFCRSMCLFCGCSVVLNRNPERQRTYLNHLLLEIDLIGSNQTVSLLHFGGGTPTSLTEEEFDLVMERLRKRFYFTPDAELSIEIDPRTVLGDNGKKLKHLKDLGFNRVSFGVQDLDSKVQEAIKRRQSEEMTRKTYEWARELGFSGINFDLIYGLPHQSCPQFVKTVEQIVAWQPDRIAFYSYANVPWLKPHQMAIAPETLPSTEEKFRIYLEARRLFLENGYMGIGMDHFSLKSDSIAAAFYDKKLIRNFQGYSVQLADEMIGLGITSIGFVGKGYFQNVKKLDEYGAMLENGRLPIERGLILTAEDQMRHWVIQSLMCRFEVEKNSFKEEFGLDFDAHFPKEIEDLKQEGLLDQNDEKLIPSEMGRLMIRIVASKFDAYLQKGKFSRAI